MEGEFLKWLRPRLPAHPSLEVGVGSDAAVLKLPSRRAVVTTDALMDGVDFVLADADPARVGRKALAVNLSDLAAMGARPVAAFISLMLPRAGALELAQGLYAGLLPLAERFQVAVAGGDTNTWNGPLAVSITAIGEPPPKGAWTRAAGRPDDWIMVTGPLGGSLLSHHFDFEPRVNLACAIADQYAIHAATDISDGLSLDLSHILSESGCGAVLEIPVIPIAPAAYQMSAAYPAGPTPLDRALGDGEDFELILTAAPDEARRLQADPILGPQLTRIGKLSARPGLWRRDAEGVETPLVPRGYQH